mmetsp:Transcript_12740/g.36674  ORF Transcript_12740/g.36674 Transcript_12740/m.36674 type:complete len:226 (+) Transcript_12740:266-943(+)
MLLGRGGGQHTAGDHSETDDQHWQQHGCKSHGLLLFHSLPSTSAVSPGSPQANPDASGKLFQSRRQLLLGARCWCIKLLQGCCHVRLLHRGSFVNALFRNRRVLFARGWPKSDGIVLPLFQQRQLAVLEASPNLLVTGLKCCRLCKVREGAFEVFRSLLTPGDASPPQQLHPHQAGLFLGQTVRALQPGRCSGHRVAEIAAVQEDHRGVAHNRQHGLRHLPQLLR